MASEAKVWPRILPPPETAPALAGRWLQARRALCRL